NAAKQGQHMGLLSRLEDSGNGPRDAVVPLQLLGELLPAGGREPVIPRASVLLGFAPLARNPPFDEHALEGRVERPFFDLQDSLGSLADGLGDLEAVKVAVAREGAKDEHVERALRDFVALSSG